jgi:hypothetical protein
MTTTKTSTQADDGTTRAVKGKIHLNAANVKNHDEKQQVELAEHQTEFQPSNTTTSIPLQTWLSQVPAEEPFNLVGWKFESSREAHNNESVSNTTNRDADRWSLEAVYSSDDE